MITKEKIKIYKKYNRDIDSWARSAKRHEKVEMDDNDWFLIEGFIQDIKLVRKGLAADSYSMDLNRKLNENCDSNETIEQLRTLAEENEDSQKDSIMNKIINAFRRKR